MLLFLECFYIVVLAAVVFTAEQCNGGTVYDETYEKLDVVRPPMPPALVNVELTLPNVPLPPAMEPSKDFLVDFSGITLATATPIVGSSRETLVSTSDSISCDHTDCSKDVEQLNEAELINMLTSGTKNLDRNLLHEYLQGSYVPAMRMHWLKSLLVKLGLAISSLFAQISLPYLVLLISTICWLIFPFNDAAICLLLSSLVLTGFWTSSAEYKHVQESLKRTLAEHYNLTSRDQIPQ